MSAAAAVAREFDLVIWGASGFTGALASEYVSRAYSPGGAVRFAFGGRDRTKLERTRERIAVKLNDARVRDVPLVVADCVEKLPEACARASCVLTFAGPYDAPHAYALVKACVEAKTHYVDITGEPQFVREVVDTVQDDARSGGVGVISCAGYDSVPWDLGVYACAKALKEDDGALYRAAAHAGKSKGGVSGGTIASAANALSSATTKKFRGMGDPFFFARDALKARKDVDGEKVRWAKPQSGTKFDEDTKLWTMPSIMAGINSKVVARSFALDDGSRGYAPNFTYDESDFCASKTAARLGTLALGVFGACFITPPLRWLMRKTILPAQGEGPSEHTRETGFSNIYVVGTGVNTKTNEPMEPVCAHFEFKNADPGYKGTAALATEVALCLAIPSERSRLSWADQPGRGGCFTASHAMGDVLIERLNKAQNFSITVAALKNTVIRV